MIVDGAQSKAGQIGRFGCYFLCWLKLAEQDNLLADVLYWYDVLEQRGLMGADPTAPAERCFVLNADGAASAVFNGVWTVTKEAADYVAKPGEREIWRLEGTGLKGHFVLPTWDPLGLGWEKRTDLLVSKRIARKVGG